MDVGCVELGLTVGVVGTWGRDGHAVVTMPTYY